MGESTSDYLVHRFDPVIAVAFGAMGLAVALAAVLRTAVRAVDILVGGAHGGRLRHDGG
jgi:hypothetical protein